MSGVGERSVRQELALPVMLGRAIDVWRERQVDRPSRPEAMRRLITRGLEAERGARNGDEPSRPEPARLHGEEDGA